MRIDTPKLFQTSFFLITSCFLLVLIFSLNATTVERNVGYVKCKDKLIYSAAICCTQSFFSNNCFPCTDDYAGLILAPHLDIDPELT